MRRQVQQVRRRRRGASGRIPVVGWPNAMIGQPPSGGAPLGAKTVPVTSSGRSSRPTSRCRSTFAATDVTATSRRSSVGKVVASRSVPGPNPLKSADMRIPASGGGTGPADGRSHAEETTTAATMAQTIATVRAHRLGPPPTVRSATDVAPSVAMTRASWRSFASTVESSINTSIFRCCPTASNTLPRSVSM